MASGAIPAPSASTPQNSEPAQPPSVPLSWEGDKMFNIYIFDYCSKRGYTKTARELVNEAEIPPGSQPPIDAKQGLLFEWWSVFWVLFQAKNNSTESEDAILYTQRSARSAPGAPPAMRFSSSMPGRPGPFPNGPLTNGVPPPGPPLPAPAQPGYGMPTPGPQPNGVPPPPPPGFQPPNQASRPTGGPQQRPQNGGPFQSPTMAPSPQTQGGPQAPSMGPSPHLSNVTRGPMPPPNPPQVNSAQHTPVFQPGRPPSRGGTPGSMSQHPMNSHPSPSMAATRPTQAQAQAQAQAQDRQLANELMAYPQDFMQKVKAEAGMGDKDLSALTTDDKFRLLTRARQLRGQPANGMMGSNNAVAGPSGGHPPPSMRNGQSASGQPSQRGAKRNSTSPGEEHEPIPRTESSPPASKRPRRTPGPGEQPQPPPMAPMNMNPGFQPPHAGHPPMPPGNMVRAGPMLPFNPQAMPGQSGLNMQMAQGMAPMMGMSPMMGHPQNSMNPHALPTGHFGGHIQNHPTSQYHQSMLNIHQKPNIGGMPPGNMIPGGPVPNNDPQAHMRGPSAQGPVPPGRMLQKGMGPMQPPKPGMPGLNKSPQVDVKPPGGDGNMQGGPQMNMGHPGNMGPHPGNMTPTPASAPPGNPGMAPSPAMNNQGGLDPPRPQTTNGPMESFSTEFLDFNFDSMPDFSSDFSWLPGPDESVAMDGLK
ncbi:hypothetical protein OF83DRAFT_433823 [Amylostereum chailletii]|nr:hypothetical protein OF83DRAFT_433823 [Amylostereum chailletii]